jgi:hypothetical protein
MLFFLFLIGFALGMLFERAGKAEAKGGFQLIMSLQLDATQPIKITAVGKDAEGNVIDLSSSDLTITAEATTGNFGEINDEQDTFNPGEAGATGTIKGSVTIDDVEYVASVDVELVPGGLAEISLDFTPTE